MAKFDPDDGDERKLFAAIGYLGWLLPRGYAAIAMPDGWDASTFAAEGEQAR
jgi:hypothetical protein